MTTSQRRDRIVLVAAALGLIFLAWPALRGDRWSFGDIKHLWFPLRYEYSRCLTSGNSLLWSPSLFCGTYLHGEGQFGLLHPATLLLYRVVPFPVSFDIESWIRYPLLVLGMYVLLRRWGLHAGPRWRGAVLLGGTTLNSYGFQHFVQIFAHIPWQLVCIDVFLRRRNPRRRALAWLGLCVLTGSHLLLGFLSTITDGGPHRPCLCLIDRGPASRSARHVRDRTGGGSSWSPGLQWITVLDVLQTSIRADTPWSRRSCSALCIHIILFK